MRLCFYNPQAVSDLLGKTCFSLISQVAAGKMAKHQEKLGFFLDVVRDKKYDTAIVVDGTASSFPFHRFPVLNHYAVIRLFSFFEVYIWCFLNGINPFKQTIIFSLTGLDPKNDVLFGFAYFTRTFFDEAMTERSFFKGFTGKKMVHVSHFYGNTKWVADNIKRTGTKMVVAEADLKKSDYFNKYFGFIDFVVILPFVLRKRYVDMVDFSQRKNKCLALGTLEIFPDDHRHTEDHFEHFKIDVLHPMRKAIYENRVRVRHVIDSLIMNKEHQSFLSRTFRHNGKKYHSFDIVEKFNEYKMFVSPEENIGLPSVNCIEGMACGCAYFGLDSPIYTDWGFKKGIHYVIYDGTLEGLVDKIEYFQQHPDELQTIAVAGQAFVVEHFQESRIVEDFFKKIEAS